MRRNEGFRYEYQGSSFRIIVDNWYLRKNTCEIDDIVTESENLYLPDTCQGNMVVNWNMRDSERSLSTVRYLFIPASIKEIDISNKLFPNLERVEVESGSKAFSTNGQMLFSADGKELLYSLVAGNKEKVVVPAAVKKLEHRAFQYSVCSEIVFENADVSAEKNTFKYSKWLEVQKDYCIIGNMFYLLKHSMDVLKVPDNVRRFHESAFREAVPVHLITPVMPARSNISDLTERHYFNGNGTCRELTITLPNAAINFRYLGEMYELQKIHLPENHKKYHSEDGVIFSSDRKRLIFYPRARQDERYEIPDGTVKIAREAFAGQRYLKEIHMPDTVVMLGMSAFYGCEALRSINLSDKIKEIPDSSAYQNGGVFQECKSLHEIVLPPKLQYLGSFAFYKSGLGKVVMSDKLKQIGEYAFAKCKMQRVSLPSSVERLGKGALAGVGEVDTYIGMAKGLVSAINTVPPNMSEKRANVEWGRCVVHARRKKGEKTEIFMIPGSLKRTAAYHLDMAWNSDQIDYEEYDACFAEITDSEEKLEFAELGILRLKDEEDTPYVSYMKHSASRIASRLLEEKKEREFLAFLERGYLSESSYGKLLKIANKNELTTCAAYLLKYQNAKGSKKTRRLSI